MRQRWASSLHAAACEAQLRLQFAHDVACSACCSLCCSLGSVHLSLPSLVPPHRGAQLVDLDRQRQECTQALANLREQDKKTAAAGAASPRTSSPGASSSSSSSASAVAGVSSPPSSLLPSALHAPAPSKLWVLSFGGSTFVRMPRASVKELLESDRRKLSEEIDRVRREMKDKMAALQRLAPSLSMEQGLLDFALA